MLATGTNFKQRHQSDFTTSQIPPNADFITLVCTRFITFHNFHTTHRIRTHRRNNTKHTHVPNIRPHSFIPIFFRASVTSLSVLNLSAKAVKDVTFSLPKFPITLVSTGTCTSLLRLYKEI